MSYPINDITAPLIQLDSVAIGFQLNNDGEASNINKLDLTSEEYLVVGEKTYYTDTTNTKWSLIVNSQGTSVNASRNLARNNLTHDTSLYVDKNIYCSGIIKAAGLELSNIRIDDTNPITCNLIKEFIVKTNDLVVSQPFQTGHITNYNNSYDINYDVKNIFTPNYVTFGGHVDTYKNTHPLNIVSTPNNKFSSMHIAIRNDTNNSEEPAKMCMGIIGGSNISPAIISTTKGVPLEFHVSRSSEDINMAYGTKALPKYNTNNIPAMTIDENNNVGIGTNYTTLKIYNKKSFINNITNNSELYVKSKLEVKGLSTFDDILLYDFITKTYKHLDDIYIRSSGVGVLNATQINGGDFTDHSYRFNNNLSVVNELSTKDIIINNNATIQSNLTTNFINVLNHSTFDGTVSFNNNVDFDNVENINVNKLNITNDLFINNKRITPLNLKDTFTGNYDTVVDGSNYLFVYVSSNIASLDANCNVNFPNKLALGLTTSDGFDGILNIIKNDRSTSNNFDIFLKNKVENKEYIANIGRLSRLDYNDNSLIFNTNKVSGKKNNIYFYPSSDISILTSNRYLPNLENTPPTLSLLDGKVGINKLTPNNMFSLDVNGIVAANDYYISQNNSFKRTKNFAYNNDKNFFNLYDASTDKFCINYNELLSYASDMRGLNVKKGINADLYYQNNILLETLQKASSEDSFYTNKKISIGWNGEQNVAPLQVRNLFTNDYNYSTIRIYRGLRGGGLLNNADYSGIDICEYDRGIEQDRNKDKWFIYKNHKYNDLDARDFMRVGPLQIGYTNKTIEPTSYGMSFYYDTATSKYHIDVNNPKVSYEDNSAMTIYGDLNVHGNINILDNEGCNFNFTMKVLSSNLQRVDRYINYISNAGDSGDGYNNSDDKIQMSFDILRSKENLVIDPLENAKTPVIIKNMNDVNPVTKFITYSKSNICYSMIELAIYNSNLQILDDSFEKINNIKNAVQISVVGNNSNTTLDFNVYNNNAYKNFLRFTNNVSDNGDANSTVAHLGLGTDKSSNILLHIDGNEKYGLQITNNQYPASINLLNSEGTNVYHNISGGEFQNNYKFTIGVSSSNNGPNEPILTDVFTIDAFKYNAEKRKGARYGFNEDFKSNTTQSFVLNTDYDTAAMGIKSRYSYEYMFNSTVKINYDDVSIDPISSNWNNNNKVYSSSYKQNISQLPPLDDNDYPIISSDITDDFIFKTLNVISNNFSYITVHSNINYQYFFSNLNINYFNNSLNLNSDSVIDDFTLTRNNDFNLIPKYIFYSSNDDIKPYDIVVKQSIINNQAQFNIDNSNIFFDYTYTNKYNLAANISSNVVIINYSNLQIVDNSNYFNISNYIITTFSTDDNPFNENNNIYEHIYVDFNQNKIDIKNKLIENSNNYLNTYTKNILKYNSNIFYNAKFFSIHKNDLNIITSNFIFDNLFDKNTAYLNISSNIIDSNNIIIKSSNYSINNNANSTPRNMIIKRLSSNIITDSFDILGNTITNNVIIEEYINDYSNINENNLLSIGIKNYNYKNYKPHISLINEVEKNNSLFEGHEIYSYDGIFEIKYSNSKNNQIVPLKIDKSGTMFLDGGLDMDGDLRFSGRIYDAHGNNLIEQLNTNYYKEYEINSSNIHFNSLGSNGLEINSYSGSNFIDYKFFYVKDMLAPNIINDILILHKSEQLDNKYNLDLYTDLYVNSNIYIKGYGNNTSLTVLQKENANIIEASNLNREILTLAYDGSMGLGVTKPQGVLLNVKQHIINSNVISASNLNREILTLAYDGSMGLGVTKPQGVLLNIKQNIINSNVISASNLNSEILTLAYDGSMGLGVTEPQGVLLNIKQNIINSNVISASNLNSEILTLAYDGSMGLGVTKPQGVLLNIKQNISGSNIISASNINKEVLTLTYQGKLGIGTQNPELFLEINSTDGIKIPKGSESERPKGNNIVGTIRYNIDTEQFEGFGAGNNWGTLGGVKDVNNDTYISAESSPGINNDELRFYTSNIEKMIIKKNGNVGIGNKQPQYLLDVNGDIRTNSNLFVNLNVGIGTTNISDSLLNIYGKLANLKIQNPDIDNPISSIEFINGINNSIKNNNNYGWKMLNSNNNYIICSGSNNIINNRLIIDGESGNVGIGTYPQTTVDINGDIYKININGSINVEGDIYRQGVLLFQGTGGTTGENNGIISQNMPIQTLSKTYTNTKTYLESTIDNDDGWRFIDDNINTGFLIKIKPSHVSSKILINLSIHIGIDSSPESIWWGLRLYRKVIDNNKNIVSNWQEVIASRPNNNEQNATPCWLSHTLGANLTSYENFVANVNGIFFDNPNTNQTIFYTVKWKTNLGNIYSGGGANIYLNRPARYNSSNSSILSSSWTATEIWQLGTPYNIDENVSAITIYNQDNINYVGIGNPEPQNSLDVTGDINVTGTYKVNNEIFKTSQWTTNDNNNIYYNNFIGIGTINPSSLLSLKGVNAKIKIQDDGIESNGSIRTRLSTSIDLINGSSNSFEYNFNKCGWRMSNSNNNYIISSGSNSIIKDRFIIDGNTGNIGIGTIPNHKLDIDGIINAKSFNLNGSPFVLDFSQGMTIQTIHKTYSKTVEKQSNSTEWVPIDIENEGFFVKIQPSHQQSKILVSVTCHIGMDYTEDSRWWGLQLYRKIGDEGEWVVLNDANGTNSGGLECSPCWISHNLGADNSMYSHSIINVSGSYEDEPNTTLNVYYTAYWKSKLDNSAGKLYINRPAYINNSNYPLTSSSWTASEIWNNGTPYKPTTTAITIAYEKVGIGITPNNLTEYKLEVNGDVKCKGLQCISVSQTSDSRYKKNIESIDSVLENINRLNPITYLTLDDDIADKKSYGFVAQEIKEIFPDIVNEPKNINELYSINYTSIIPLLTKSIQELSKKIEMLQHEINYLKQKL